MGACIVQDRLGNPRSPHWPALERDIIGSQSWCSICGAVKHLIVHHIKPFHLFPELELDPNNLIVLCEGTMGYLAGQNCHLVFGHLGNWTKYNQILIPDTVNFLQRLFLPEPRQIVYPRAA